MKTIRFAILPILIVLLTLVLSPASASPGVAKKVYLPMVFYPSVPPESSITNPGFELGTLGWTIASNGGDTIVTDWNLHTGFYSAQLGDGRDNRFASIAQTVRVPYLRPVLQYWQYVESYELCPFDPDVEFDYLTILLNGTEIQHYDICLNMLQGAWETWSLDLSAYAGRSVQLKFEFHSDNQLSSQLYLDDFFFSAK